MINQEYASGSDDYVTREELKHIGTIRSKMEAISELKRDLALDWKEFAEKEDIKWGKVILEGVIGMALGAVTAGIGGLVAKHLTTNLVKQFKLLGEGAKSAIKDVVDNLLGVGISAVSGFKSTVKVSDEDLRLTYYRNVRDSFREERDSYNGFEAKYKTPEELEKIAIATSVAYDQLKKTQLEFYQQLTVGYVLLQENLKDYKEADVSEEDSKDIIKNKVNKLKQDTDGTYFEYGAKEGRIAIRGFVKKPSNAAPELWTGSHDGLNKTLAGFLTGMKIKDLPLSIAFQFKCHEMSEGEISLWDGFELPNINFVKLSNNRIGVDENQSWINTKGGQGEDPYRLGRTWLAKYHLQTKRELTEKEIESNMEKGAKKLYGEIQNMEVPKLYGPLF